MSKEINLFNKAPFNISICNKIQIKTILGDLQREKMILKSDALKKWWEITLASLMKMKCYRNYVWLMSK